jgi:hypothetical protein
MRYEALSLLFIPLLQHYIRKAFKIGRLGRFLIHTEDGSIKTKRKSNTHF